MHLHPTYAPLPHPPPSTSHHHNDELVDARQNTRCIACLGGQNVIIIIISTSYAFFRRSLRGIVVPSCAFS